MPAPIWIPFLGATSKHDQCPDKLPRVFKLAVSLQSHQDFLEYVWNAHDCFVRWMLKRGYQTLPVRRSGFPLTRRVVSCSTEAIEL